MDYKKGDIIEISDSGITRLAVVVKDGIDSKGRVRVKPNGFPFDISIPTETNNNLYVIKNQNK
jgi:hypothetical protein